MDNCNVLAFGRQYLQMGYRCRFQMGTQTRDGWGNVGLKHGVCNIVKNNLNATFIVGKADEAFQFLFVEVNKVLTINHYVPPRGEHREPLCCNLCSLSCFWLDTRTHDLLPGGLQFYSYAFGGGQFLR